MIHLEQNLHVSMLKSPGVRKKLSIVIEGKQVHWPTTGNIIIAEKPNRKHQLPVPVSA